MQIRSIAGMENSSKVYITGVSDELGVYGKKKAKKGKLKSAFKKATSKAKNLAKKAFQGYKTVIGAAPRNAFLLLVRLNVFGIATKLNQLVALKGWDAVKFWKQIGGNRSNLEAAAKAGAKKKRIFGIGSASIATAIATATPIIIKLNALLKQYGIKPASKESKEGAEDSEEQSTATNTDTKAESEGDAEANNIVKKLVVARSTPKSQTSESEGEGEEQSVPVRSARRSTPTPSNNSENAVTNPAEQNEEEETPKKKKKPIKKILGMSPKVAGVVGVSVLAAGVLGYLATRKKGKGKK
ncbi:MAG: hypothetical protein RLZZ414_1063 [Bacteroidota bacterium]|jgi:hypothetical protein